VKTKDGWIQGYNAQAAVNEAQIVVAAEVTVDSPDFGHLDPMVEAVEAELEAAGVTDTPDVVVADAGYWHQKQIEKIVSRGIQVLNPARCRQRAKAPARAGTAASTAFMRRVLDTDTGAEPLPQTQRHDSSRCSGTRSSTGASIASSARGRSAGPLRMAPDHRDA